MAKMAAEPPVHDYRRETLRFGHEIRRFEALAPGRYEVEGVGPGLEAGHGLRFTLKGSQSLHLTLAIQEVRYRLIPEHSWVAVLTGEDFTSLDIHAWKVRCDACGTLADFEFAVPGDASAAAKNAAASARVAELGWHTVDGGHRCAACRSPDGAGRG